jgi:outer membrane protein OmpA-like peptidoglycan-associated protein
MTKSGMLMLATIGALAAATFAQNTETPQAAPVDRSQIAVSNFHEVSDSPTESDIYCAGFITPHALSESSKLVGGWDSPDQTRFGSRDYIYVSGGGEIGKEYQILRHVKDPNKYEPFKGQKVAVQKLGEVYAELGRAQIIAVENGIGIAKVSLSCDTFIPGDIAVPWEKRDVPDYRISPNFDRFAPPNGKTTGRIVAANEFDTLLGTKGKVYLSVGSSQGVKVGDYFRVTRTYSQTAADANDSLAFIAPSAEDTAKNPMPILKKEDVKNWPRRSLGEMMIINATPSSATGMITFALQPVQVGDGVEMIDPPPMPTPPPPPVMNPPQLSCVAQPASVRLGETTTIRCEGSSADDRPLSYTFSSGSGRLTPRENVATLDTTGAHAGTITVSTTVVDDRNLSAAATTNVNVEAPPAPAMASHMTDLMFKPNSAYVDNRAKAVLDQVALAMQRDANSTALLAGYTAPGESNRLATLRAANAKTYLSKDKGVDANRINTREGGGSAGRVVQVYTVPAGAAMPSITPPAPQAMPAPMKKPAAKKPAAKH